MSKPNGGNTYRDPIRLSVTPSHRLVPPGAAGTVWFLVTLTAEKAESASRRLPLNLGLVLDRSGSMAGKPLDYVKHAACRAVEQMDANDLFSLVVFDDQVDVVRPAGPLADKDPVKAGISGIQTRGSTNLSGGLIQGYRWCARTPARAGSTGCCS